MVPSGRDSKPEFQKIKKICGLTNLFIYYCSFDCQIDVQKKDLTLSLRVLSISDIVWEQSKLVLHYLNRTKQSGFLQFPSVQSSDSNPTVQRKYTQPALHPPINIICKNLFRNQPPQLGNLFVILFNVHGPWNIFDWLCRLLSANLRGIEHWQCKFIDSQWDCLFRGER